MALPSHHGQAIVAGAPPTFEITWPVPRQGAHGSGSVRACWSVVAIAPHASSALAAASKRPTAGTGIALLSTLDATGRYAPSPTGSLHLGNLRTALLAWLFARS